MEDVGRGHVSIHEKSREPMMTPGSLVEIGLAQPMG